MVCAQIQGIVVGGEWWKLWEATGLDKGQTVGMLVFQVLACLVSVAPEEATDMKAKLLDSLDWGGQTLTEEEQQQLKMLVTEWDSMFAVETIKVR